MHTCGQAMATRERARHAAAVDRAGACHATRKAGRLQTAARMHAWDGSDEASIRSSPSLFPRSCFSPARPPCISARKWAGPAFGAFPLLLHTVRTCMPHAHLAVGTGRRPPSPGSRHLRRRRASASGTGGTWRSRLCPHPHAGSKGWKARSHAEGVLFLCLPSHCPVSCRCMAPFFFLVKQEYRITKSSLN
jgi:hypothetical protein